MFSVNFFKVFLLLALDWGVGTSAIPAGSTYSQISLVSVSDPIRAVGRSPDWRVGFLLLSVWVLRGFASAGFVIRNTQN